MAEDPEHAEVCGHYDQAQDPGHEGDCDSKQRSNDTSADGNNPSDERHTASDSMEDHRSSEAVGGAGFDVGELGTVGGGDDVSGLITNVAPRAPVGRISAFSSVKLLGIGDGSCKFCEQWLRS